MAFNIHILICSFNFEKWGKQVDAEHLEQT